MGSGSAAKAARKRNLEWAAKAALIPGDLSRKSNADGPIKIDSLG